jgi:hypothetical protein
MRFVAAIDTIKKSSPGVAGQEAGVRVMGFAQAEQEGACEGGEACLEGGLTW